MAKIIKQSFAYSKDLDFVLSQDTAINRYGYPIIAQKGFDHFIAKIPHLFRNGLNILNALAERSTPDKSAQEQARAVVRTMVYTAAITAPSDLWTLGYVLGTLQECGLGESLSLASGFRLKDFCQQHGLDAEKFSAVLHFLVARGFLEFDSATHTYTAAQDHKIRQVLTQTIWQRKQLEDFDFVPALVTYLKGETLSSKSEHQLEHLFSIDRKTLPMSPYTLAWLPTAHDIAIGFQLVPVVLAMRSFGLTASLRKGANFIEACSDHRGWIQSLFYDAGMIDADHSTLISALGERVLTRGPGPMGIVHAYHPYMFQLKQLIQGKRSKKFWVARAQNVAASQDANAKTFALCNASLDRYCESTGYQYQIYIEHAVGRGEATRQRWKSRQGSRLKYYGFDLEDDSIAQAKAAQAAGDLPAQMILTSGADIANAELVIQTLLKHGDDPSRAIMIVGNGFHEVRGQSNERMIEIFKVYAKAGILLIFTEETALSDEDLRHTAWNTYHAGFRMMHALSGQGLRPAYERVFDEQGQEILSWSKCAELGGYQVLDEYSIRTRTIYPHPRADGYNPSISVSYFCVPL